MKALRLISGLFVYALTIGVVLAGLVTLWGVHEFNRPGPSAESALFEVQRGKSANDIAFQLHDQNLIHDPFMFMIGVTVLGDHTRLKAGEYEIEARASAHDIMRIMRDGKTVQRQFTIQEGLTSFEIVALLNGILELSENITEIPAEGALLPQTYSYSLNEKRQDIIKRLENNMIAEVTALCGILLERTQNFSFDDLTRLPCGAKPLSTIGEVLTLASIVEKETGVPEERARIAGVFINRLRAGIALQTDPTVIYALTQGKPKNDGKGPLGRRLLKKDLELDSPYNTYKYPGLPPTPIANPGRASIEAVLNPEAHDFIYFVADGSGGHVFAKTLAEHNANVAKWRKIRHQQSN